MSAREFVSTSISSSQVHEEFHPPPPPIDYTSTTKKDFSKGTYANTSYRCFDEEKVTIDLDLSLGTNVFSSPGLV